MKNINKSKLEVQTSSDIIKKHNEAVSKKLTKRNKNTSVSKKKGNANKIKQKPSSRGSKIIKPVEAQIQSSPVVFTLVLEQLAKEIPDLPNDTISKSIQEIISFHNRMIINHKVIEGTARFNSIRLYAIKLLEGQNPEPLDRVAIGRKDRWPSAFNQLRPLFYRVRDKGCAISDRCIRSILYLNRLCSGNSNGDFTEITKEFKLSNDFIKRYEEYVNTHIPSYEGELITYPPTRVLRNGPNGKPKWQTSDVESYALMRSELHDHFKALCEATGNLDFYEYVKSRSDQQDRVTRVKLRNIVTVRDKGNKCRLVAISDYWTQIILKPIMDDISRFNRTEYHTVSYSHNHAEGFNMLKKHIRPGVYSYDVSSWTDAFPNVLQHRFMQARYGKYIADAWYNLVVDCEWTCKGHKEPIKYNRGQGMGTNGSFDIATAADHALLHMIYEQDYKIPVQEETYGKVGDDLWCFDPSHLVYNTYINECGISINENKSKHATDNNLCGEFVSRNLNYGKDVSRISPNICRAVGKNILDLPQLSTHLDERNYESIIPIKEILDILKIKEVHRTNVVATLYLLSLLYDRPGMELLRKSLVKSVPFEIFSNKIIRHIRTYGIHELRDMYYSYSISLLLNSIKTKEMDVFDATFEFEGGAELDAMSRPDIFWKVDEGIPLLTSKHIAGKTLGALDEFGRSQEPEGIEDMLSILEDLDQSMTFKALGVISSDVSPWRPKATKLFNLVKSLVLQEHSSTTVFETSLVTSMEVLSKSEIIESYYELLDGNDE